MLELLAGSVMEGCSYLHVNILVEAIHLIQQLHENPLHLPAQQDIIPRDHRRQCAYLLSAALESSLSAELTRLRLAIAAFGQQRDLC